MRNNYKVIYYYSVDDECYLSFAPELPGCFSDGETKEEAIANLKVVVNEWIDTANDLDRDIPKPMANTFETTHPDILAVSKYILQKTGNISTMTLEKLNYYCLVWSLVWFNQAIFDNKFQAWRDGPVCKELYEIHRGRRIISENMINSSHELCDEEKRIVDCILAVYGTENGEFLSALTHSENPWKITRGNIPSGASSEETISNELIRKAYMY